jgi:hypothetical protein
MTDIEIFTKIVRRSITEIEIPKTINKIGDYVFNSCAGLTTVIIPDNIKTIGNYVFIGCSNLKSIEIPSSVETFGTTIFANSTGALSLKTITFKQPSGMSLTLPPAGSGSGLFYCKTASTLTVYTDNEIVKNYDWATDNVTPTLYHLDGTAWA